MVTDKVVIGTAPDSWGIWFADDPNQTPADRFLDEVVQAGYEWIEIGAYGYLSTDPAKLRDDLGSRRLKVSGGTTFAGLHHPGTFDAVWEHVTHCSPCYQEFLDLRSQVKIELERRRRAVLRRRVVVAAKIGRAHV